MNSLFPFVLKRVTDRELEFFRAVAKVPVRLFVRVQRQPVAESQQSQRRQPFYCDSHGMFKSFRRKFMADRIPQAIIKTYAAGVKYVADIVEKRRAC